jgi:hypothetical protein
MESTLHPVAIFCEIDNIWTKTRELGKIIGINGILIKQKHIDGEDYRIKWAKFKLIGNT